MVERAWFDSKIAQKGQVHFTLSEKNIFVNIFNSNY